MKQIITSSSSSASDASPLNIIFALVLILFVQYIWPAFIPFSTFEFWFSNGSLIDWLQVAHWYFLYGFIFLVIALYRRGDEQIFKDYNCGISLPETPKGLLKIGFAISLFAGVVEELLYRWLYFYASMIMIVVFNFIVGGFIGLDLIAWLNTNVLIPVADWVSFGYLHEILYHPAGWYVGAGLLLVNGKFRDGHAYQGLKGWISSWIFGMLMFYMLFTYGLFACIVIHFLYDMMIFASLAIYTAVRPRIA